MVGACVCLPGLIACLLDAFFFLTEENINCVFLAEENIVLFLLIDVFLTEENIALPCCLFNCFVLFLLILMFSSPRKTSHCLAAFLIALFYFCLFCCFPHRGNISHTLECFPHRGKHLHALLGRCLDVLVCLLPFFCVLRLLPCLCCLACHCCLG